MTIPAIAPPLIPEDEDSWPEAEAEAGATMLTVEEELDCERLDEDECLLLEEDVMLLDVLVEVRELVDVVVRIKDDDEEEEVVGTDHSDHAMNVSLRYSTGASLRSLRTSFGGRERRRGSFDRSGGR